MAFQKLTMLGNPILHGFRRIFYGFTRMVSTRNLCLFVSNPCISVPKRHFFNSLKLTIYRTRLPLRYPYRLSIGTVYEFDSIIITIDNGSRIFWGEATPLGGYSWETKESIWRVVNKCAKAAEGSLLNLEKRAYALMRKYPFAASSMLTAIEKVHIQGSFERLTQEEIPLAAVVRINTRERLDLIIGELIGNGYSVLKIKLLGSIKDDITNIKKIQRLVGSTVKLRLDANQSYNSEMVKKLFKEIRPDNIELLEQPFKRNAWQAVESLAKWSPVPIMLDESIWIADDIKKASECRAGFVKLKLMKHGGIRNTVKLAKLAQGLGLKVILGNGVQTDLGCLDECYAYKFANLKLAGEMNGFLKLKYPLLPSGIYQKNGMVIADLKKAVGNTEGPNIKKRHILKKISLKMRGQI